MITEELIQKILSLAAKGISRADLMASGLAPQKLMAVAIKECKNRGMYSVPDMAYLRGTYYQFNG